MTDMLRKNRGLGMLLANMGGNKDKETTSNEMIHGGTAGGSRLGNEGSHWQVANAAPDGHQGFDLSSSGFSGWGDISSNPNGDGRVDDSAMMANERNSGQGMGGNTSAGPEEYKSKGQEGTKKFQDEDVYGPKSMNAWADIKEYDDDHDQEWFEGENKRLAKLYGGNFISVKYLESQPGRVGYFCQLCSAEMNAKKSLELHCSGMKHLKRKDQWEKGDISQEQVGKDLEKGPPPSRWSTRGHHQSHGQSWPDRDRGYGRRDSHGGHGHHTDRGSYRGPPSPDYRKRERDYYDTPRRDDYDRYAANYYDDYYRKDTYRSQYDRDQYDRRRSSTPDMRHDYDRHPGPARRDAGDRYSRERYNPYGRREAPSPPVISGPSKSSRGKMPHPPSINDVDVVTSMLYEGISDGSCSELLKKLSACRVKTWEDAALATNVATFLISSLREYYSKTGPPTSVHVLDEIVLKMNIMKDLMK